MLFTGSRYIVAGVTLLIAYIAITSQIFVFIPWLWSISIERTLQVLVPFNIGVALIYWHYYLACTTEPGSPPPGWGDPEAVEDPVEEKKENEDLVGAGVAHIPTGHTTATEQKSSELRERSVSHQDLTPTSTAPSSSSATAVDSSSHNNNQLDKSKKKPTPLPRFCRTCEAFKPPRSHHCRICKKCVLKMDHHCPWINNCVGHFNYGHFLRFVTWVTITTGSCMVLLIWRIVDAIQNETYYMFRDDGPTKTQIIFMAVNIMVDGCVLLAVGMLCVYHLWSLMTNTSTIEAWEQEKVEGMIKKGKIRKTKFPYDIGCMRNYRQVLGPSIWLWLWPQHMLGSGTEYEVNDDKDAAKIWPPREYQTSKRQDRTFVSEYSSSAIQQRRRAPRSRNLSSLEIPVGPASDKYLDRKNRGSRSRNGASRSQQPSQFPTHVRRGSEGWVVQDLTVQQRAELFDRQMQYQRDHGADQDDNGDYDEEEVYQEGLSDIEGDVYNRLPGGMQGSKHSYEDYNDDNTHEEGSGVEESSEEGDDIPYDVASDEYDDDLYDEYGDYVGNDDDFDDHNPYLAYDEDEDEDEDIEESESEQGQNASKDDYDIEDDEVALHGRDRHKIGRFFDNVGPSNPTASQCESDSEDIWDEGEGVDVGCRPPGLTRTQVTGEDASHPLRYDPQKKTFYTMLVEREEALKKQKKGTTSTT
ncbi:Palmitoyltransferase [Mortierella polycephala]|uniref:Palmitoyltransferase n=1 Tax=Mortierella polycephala TaxID=41804 RepID=A0A9P6Q6M9_9FUNG|nr:Palmitoyltransferase [Mortierella polycephala]